MAKVFVIERLKSDVTPDVWVPAPRMTTREKFAQIANSGGWRLREETMIEVEDSKLDSESMYMP